MKSYFTYLYFIALLLLFCCKKENLFPGYSKTDTGLYYKLEGIGDGTSTPKQGDYLEVSIVYKTMKDSVFLNTHYQNFFGKIIIPSVMPSFKGSFEEGLLKLNEGDSASYIVSADSLFSKFLKIPMPVFFNNGDMLKTEIKLYKILNEKKYQEELKYIEQLAMDMDMEEQRLLSNYITTNNITTCASETGLYYIPVCEGAGPAVEQDKDVTIRYKGMFLDGKIFDSTYDKEPFEFIMGKEKQLIEGLEQGITLMKEGSKAKFIIPSQLAFGDKGSSTGIVPPYATVVYELEVIKVK